MGANQSEEEEDANASSVLDVPVLFCTALFGFSEEDEDAEEEEEFQRRRGSRQVRIMEPSTGRTVMPGHQNPMDPRQPNRRDRRRPSPPDARSADNAAGPPRHRAVGGGGYQDKRGQQQQYYNNNLGAKRNPKADIEDSEKAFLHEFKLMMVEGFKVKKHGRRGNPHFRTIRLSEDTEQLFWDSKKKINRESDFIFTSDILEITRGGFDGVPMSREQSARCFSLVTTDRRLDFETNDAETRELIADGFQLLLVEKGYGY